jgi:UDP-N-acetylmuramyl pentapeptide synthase
MEICMEMTLFVNKFSTDSRNINKGDVFICLKGKNYDGHDFIEDSLINASCIISSKNIRNIDLKTKSYIKVDDTLKSLTRFKPICKATK